MAPNIPQRIESLEERLKALKAQQARADSRRRSLVGRRARQEELRRKVLVGAVVLARIDQGLLEESVLRGWLEGALERPDDRALFDLPAAMKRSGDDVPMLAGRGTLRQRSLSASPNLHARWRTSTRCIAG